MAIRYAGDVEIRIAYDASERAYRATVRDLMQPRLRWKGTVRRHYWQSAIGYSHSKSYDAAAREALREAQKWARAYGKRFSKGGAQLSRIFQSACPE